ncbi:MAG: hypothetical protein ABI273_12220 [Lacunisphaera sp.]
MPRPPAGWLWTGGVALAVFAARCREIQIYASDTPYLDQWWVEAHQIIVPWLQGKLSWTDFFQSHHEHIPVWTRLLAWLEAACLGRWDPKLQCTINAALFGLAAGVWTGWLRRVAPLVPALLLTALTVALAALPHGWENSTWGFQSLVPIALVLVIWQVRGSFEQPVNSPKWWLAQAAGLGALFTFGSVWAAPVAVVITVFWTSAQDRRGRWLAPALIGATGFILLLVARAHQPHSGAYVQSAGSLQEFLASFLLQLGWPSQWPGVAILMYMPTLLLAFQLRRNRAAANVDRIAMALGLFAIAQAAAFAYGRSGGYIGFVSRYGDLLSLGVLANAFALWRLLQGLRSWRPFTVLLCVGWLAAFTIGLKWISTRAHTEYFHEHAAAWGALRRDAVKDYLVNHDASRISSADVRAVLYPDPAIVTAVLDQPGLRNLLPVSLRPAGPRERGDFISAVAGYVRAEWPTLMETAALLFLAGVGFTLGSPRSIVPAGPGFPADRGRIPLLATLAALTGAGIFLWPMPLQFHGTKRWSQMLVPPGVVTGLSFHITTPTTYPVDNLTGGAALWPEAFRNTFYGTHIDGPAFKGRAQSSLFPINSPWLVIPYAGFPASAGNSLRLQFEDKSGQILGELICPGPNPPNIDFWSADVRAYAGKLGRLVFYDGRDDAEGWLAAVPPQPAQDGEKAARLHRAWQLELTTSAHRSLGIIFLTLAGLTGLMALAKSQPIKQNQ